MPLLGAQKTACRSSDRQGEEPIEGQKSSTCNFLLTVAASSLLLQNIAHWETNEINAP
jgi:hypothetical protein